MAVPQLTKRAVSAAWWSAVEIAARYGVQFAVMVVVARLLTASDFGLVAMLQVFTSIGALLIDSGFGTALIQRQKITADDETTVFIAVMFGSAIVVLVLWFLAPAIAIFYSQSQLVPLVRFLAFSLPIGALAMVPDALLTMRLDFRARTRAEVTASLCSGGVAVVLAWRGFGVWSLVWQSMVAIGVRMLLLWHFSGWHPHGKFRMCSFRSLLGFGSYLMLSNLLELLSIRIQSLLIGRLFDSQVLGYYALAQNTQQAPAAFMSGILNRVGLPMFSVVADQPKKLLGALRLSLRVAIFLFLPCMFGIAAIAKPLILMLYGARWVPAAPMLSILAVSASIWPVHVLNLAAISALGKSRLFFRLAIVKKVVMIGLVIASSGNGPLAIALAVLISSLFSAIVNTWYSKELLGYGAVRQLIDQSGTMLLALTAAGVGWAILHWTMPDPFNTLAAILVAAFVYVLLAAVTRNLAFIELIGLARTLRARPIVDEP